MTSLTRSKVEHTLKRFLEHVVVLKMFHFQTKRYGAHKASDAYLTKFLVGLDQYMEVAQGIVGTVSQKHLKLHAQMVTDSSINDEMHDFIVMLSDARSDDAPELHGLIDTMIGDAQQFKYLLSFR